VEADTLPVEEAGDDSVEVRRLPRHPAMVISAASGDIPFGIERFAVSGYRLSLPIGRIRLPRRYWQSRVAQNVEGQGRPQWSIGCLLNAARKCGKHTWNGDLALPNGENSPAQGAEGSSFPNVPLSISEQLPFPELAIACGQICAFTLSVVMPKAPMNENCRPILRENQVRLAGQASWMKPKSKPTPVEISSHREFRLGILSTNTRHHRASGRAVDNV
jgi:hypothetical protein